MTKSNFNNIKDYVHQLIYHYAIFDELSNQYVLELNDIPDFDVMRFASILMLENQDYAAEATGCDNKYFERSMLPALITYLYDTTNRDNMYEFSRIWREGVTNYFWNKMQELINDQVSLYKGNYEWVA